MKFTLAGLLAALLLDMHAPPPVDACGVKLTVKSRAPRKAVARSSNPSEVLLLGRPPRRLERDLAAAGHRVDVAPNAAAAKKKNYAVVIADADKQGEAKQNFTSSVVMVRSNDPSTDMRSVENQVARRPTAVATGGTVVDAKPKRPVLAAGGGTEKREPLDAKPGPGAEPVAPNPPPTPPPARVEAKTEAKVETKVEKTEPKPEVDKPTPEPKPKAVAKAGVKDEVYFSLGKAEIDGTNKLTKVAKWLADNSSVQVVIEGHADPSGSAAGNQALGQQRAEWVKEFLVSAGVDGSRLEVISYGDTKLRYGRRDGRNRRAAIVIKP
jgi:outer membrane protein OmpA-like peptidoglycan-associated protein